MTQATELPAPPATLIRAEHRAIAWKVDGDGGYVSKREWKIRCGCGETAWIGDLAPRECPRCGADWTEAMDDAVDHCEQEEGEGSAEWKPTREVPRG